MLTHELGRCVHVGSVMVDKEPCVTNDREASQQEIKAAPACVSIENIQLACSSTNATQAGGMYTSRSYFSMTSSWILKEDLVKAALRLRHTKDRQRLVTNCSKNTRIFYVKSPLFPINQWTPEPIAPKSSMFNRKQILYLCNRALQRPITAYESRAQELNQIKVVDEVGILSEVADRTLIGDFYLNDHPSTIPFTWSTEQSPLWTFRELMIVPVRLPLCGGLSISSH